MHRQEVFSSDPSFSSREVEKTDTTVSSETYQITEISKIGKNYLLNITQMPIYKSEVSVQQSIAIHF